MRAIDILSDRVDSAVRSPVFIVGAPRSGTSILTWSLGQHPNMLPLEETNWIARLAVDLGVAFKLGTCNDLRSHLTSMAVTREELYTRAGTLIDSLIVDHRQDFKRTLSLPENGTRNDLLKVFRRRSDPHNRWVDGTPENSFYIAGLIRLFPEAKFIHILRDVEQVVRSMMTFKDAFGKQLVDSEEEAYDYWRRAVQACIDAERALGSGQMMRIRYSNLASDPDPVLRACLEFLGERYDPECAATLGVRINSSSTAGDFHPNADPASSAVVQARELNQRAAAEGPRRLRASSVLRKQIEADFEERVDLSQGLDAERLSLIQALKHTEHELDDRTAWAQSLDEKLSQSGQAIEQLEADLSDKTTWALQLQGELEQARERIAELEQTVTERTSWAKSLDRKFEEDVTDKTDWAMRLHGDLEKARERIAEMEQTIIERTAWARSLDEQLEQARSRMTALEATVDERTKWAQQLDAELERLRKRPTPDPAPTSSP